MNKRNTGVLAALIGSMVCAGALVAKESVLLVGEKDSGKLVSVSVGQELDVELPGNITTGYSWVLTPGDEAKVLKQKGKIVYTQPEVTAPGLGGKFTTKFKAIAKGEGRVNLQYIRPWEKDIPPARTFSIDIEVE